MATDTRLIALRLGNTFYRFSSKCRTRPSFVHGVDHRRSTWSRPVSARASTSHHRTSYHTSTTQTGTASDIESLLHVNEYFEFTRARFLVNEAHELSIRRVKFHIEELARVAAQSVDASRCVRISKYPDGLYNKAMLLTMDNGKEVVAKVPHPNAGVAHYTIASEVATMEFVCSESTMDASLKTYCPDR